MKKLIILVLAFLFFFFIPKVLSAIDCNTSTNINNLSSDDLNQFIGECQKKVSSLQQEKDTLSSQIQFMDTQIYLTTLQIQDTENKITQTQSEIENLGGRIEGLNSSLDNLSRVLVKKIAERYKRRDIPLFAIFLDSQNASTLINNLQYVKRAEENDQKLAFKVQQAKSNFEEQKSQREKKEQELSELQSQLDGKKADLDNQKQSKQTLLAETKNSEAVFQSLLAEARAEFAAIQGIIAGAGTEEQVREVHKGDTIASIISGSSCNSSGSHVHFTVLEGSNTANPFNYLHDAPHNDFTGGDPWTPSGSWDWPIDPTIEFDQGYGETQCVKYGFCGQIYNFHNGLDIMSSSYSVHAVADGTLYRGSYSVGCSLHYSKIVHSGSNISTLYLHTITQ